MEPGPERTTEERVLRLERQVELLTAALHLLTVSAAPTSKWLDVKMAKLNEESG